MGAYVEGGKREYTQTLSRCSATLRCSALKTKKAPNTKCQTEKDRQRDGYVQTLIVTSMSGNQNYLHVPVSCNFSETNVPASCLDFRLCAKNVYFLY